ncbi:MAG TPA: MazG family protein [Streptosporangiaceae bacterium]|nr:MazG family protein [Streptosporangiaceae bacterium]
MPDQDGHAVYELAQVMDRLRRECPWDMRQTHASLAPYLLEETYEALDALDRGDLADLREELGDVLLQVVFHARVAAERTDGTAFDLDDVAGDIAAKLVRRHPHVFGDVAVCGPEEVRRNWNAIKAAERAAAGSAKTSALDGVPMSQPALSLAAQLQRRAEAAGAPRSLADLPAKAPEPAGPSVTGGEAGERPAGTVSQLGADLFALVSKARAAGLNPELELRHAARVYSDRVRAWESSG